MHNLSKINGTKKRVIKKPTANTIEGLNEIEGMINSSVGEVQEHFTEIFSLGAWSLSGYKSFKQYVENEFPNVSYPRARKMARAGEVLCNVGERDFKKKYSVRSILPLTKLLPKEQSLVWEALQEKCGEEEMTSTWLTKEKVDEAIQTTELPLLRRTESDIFNNFFNDLVDLESQGESSLISITDCLKQHYSSEQLRSHLRY